MLAAHRQRQEAERRMLRDAWEDTGLVFTHPAGGWIAPSNFGRVLDRLTDAAAHREATVRRVVMVSSTRMYPASARTPLLHPESEPLPPRRGGLAAALVEAEDFIRDLATENPNLSVSILRFAELAGPGTP